MLVEFELNKEEEQDIKPDFGPVGSIVDIRTYRRWLPNKKRRETFVERNARVVGANLDLVKDIISDQEYELERSTMMDHMNKLLALPSGRSMWIAGTEANRKHPASSFNCSALAINRVESFTTVFELLMLGTGVGFRVFGSDINKLSNIKKFDILFDPYNPKPKHERIESTIVSYSKNATIVQVGDSREGWIHALHALLEIAFCINKDTSISFNFDSVRPLGERINGFGGTASGHEALKNLLKDVFDIFNECPDSKLRSIDCLDICCAIAKGVVAGNTRRSALICIFEEGDDLMANAKVNLFDDPALQNKYYRIQSNNTEALGSKHLVELREFLEANPDVEKKELWKFIDQYKPSVEWLKARFKVVANAGDPGFANYLKMVGTKWLAVRKYRSEVLVSNIWDWFCDICTNPCFKGDTLILTKTGYYPIKDLVGKVVDVWDGTQWVSIDNFRVTGQNQEVYTLTLQSGQTITATPYHKFILKDGTEKQLKDLQVGDYLASHDVKYHGTHVESGAYLKGFLLGDGTSIKDRPMLHLYETKYGCKDRLIESCEAIEVEEVNTNSVTTPGFKDPIGNKALMQGLTCRKNSLLPWVTTYRDELPYEILNWSLSSKLEFLAGFMDADGTASDTTNGFMYQITSVNPKMLDMIQKLLISIGVKSSLRLMKEAGKTDFGEDGGGVYNTQTAYRITISQKASILLAEQISFSRLVSFSNKTTTYNLKDKSNRIESIDFAGVEDKVYCCTVPTNHQVSLGIGVVTGQCHEIILSVGYKDGKGTGFCNLTTLPINKFVIKKCNNNDLCAVTGYKLDEKALEQAIKLTVRIATRQTFVTMPRAELDDTQKAERLLGVSVTGWIQLFNKLDLSYTEQEDLMTKLNDWANDEATTYANKLGIERPLMVCCIKPEGCGKISHIRTTTEGLLRVDEIGDVSKLGFNKVDTNNTTTKGFSIRSVYNNGLSKVVKIKLNNGRELVFTLQHPFSVNGLWKNAVNLKKGDVLDIELDTYNKVTNELLANYSAKYNHLRKEDLLFPKEITNDLSWWVASVFANGSVTNHAISFYSGYIEVVQKFVDLTISLFSITTVAKKDKVKDMYRVDIASTDLIEYLKLNGLLKTKDFTIPLIIRRSSREALLSFICGYLDNDGCFKNKGCSITTKNENFARMLQEVGEAVGLSFSCYDYTRETTKSIGTYYDLQLSRTYSTNRAIDFINSNSIKSKLNGFIISSDKSHKNPYKVDSVEVLEELINTYDIEVDDPHWYYQGGIKSHNTGSKVLGSSSGVHWDWAPYYINRIQMGANDALAKTLKDQGFSWIPTPYDLLKLYNDQVEVFSNNNVIRLFQRLLVRFNITKSKYEPKFKDVWSRIEHFRSLTDKDKQEAFNNSNAVLFEFPVNSGMVESQGSVSASRQLQNVLRFTDCYVDHMVSSTITAKEDEWDNLAEELHQEKNWSRFINAAFLSYYSGNHPLLPNEEITEEVYNKMMSSFKDSKWVKDGKFYVNEDLLAELEQAALKADVDIDDVDLGANCTTGQCPVR
jgi:intein/homing endonuclease